jgi:hypothetical protein
MIIKYIKCVMIEKKIRLIRLYVLVLNVGIKKLKIVLFLYTRFNQLSNIKYVSYNYVYN